MSAHDTAVALRTRSGTSRGTISEAARSGNSLRPLTPQLDVTERGLAMKATPIIHHARSPRWLGPERDYQREAHRVYAIHTQRPVLAWSWISLTCDLPLCLDAECMVVHAPTHIDYPAGICVYCGTVADTRDHLIPRNLSGETLRRLVAVVPACRECNSRIADHPAASVTERREVAQARLRRRHERILSVPDKTEADLRELGPGLRSVAIKNNRLRVHVRARLAWPEDPHYDIRAFQKSGIDDPYALGLA